MDHRTRRMTQKHGWGTFSTESEETVFRRLRRWREARYPANVRDPVGIEALKTVRSPGNQQNQPFGWFVRLNRETVKPSTAAAKECQQAESTKESDRWLGNRRNKR